MFKNFIFLHICKRFTNINIFIIPSRTLKIEFIPFLEVKCKILRIRMSWCFISFLNLFVICIYIIYRLITGSFCIIKL